MIIANRVRQLRNIVVGKDVTVEEGAVIENNAVLGDHVVIGKGAVIGANTIIGYSETRNKPGGSSPSSTIIGGNAIVRSGTVIYSGTRIGDNSMVGHNCVLRERTVVGHDTCIGTLSCVEGDTKIGNYVGIQSQCYITKYCIIGDYTFIAPCFAGANDAAMTYRREGHGKNLAGFTTEKYVRFAIGVIVLPGVFFGEGCIVGAGSVVTKDVPRYTLVMGIPARAVRPVSQDEVILPEQLQSQEVSCIRTEQ
jgi:UDP-2-acetamido-3-amino-2,3-dideoxy-glucuronate N-acetyltransferase